ncbi:MAG: ADP-ribosylglycohydrolase family protein [Deltaproteobacteria bacterium]|nr:ADP-ribosylglycohydrolase family protein [Deltaproteobacteria bacterium]
MLGAIAGDIIGSVYEAHPVKSAEFPLFSRYSTFTDDTVLTVAVAYAILERAEYAETLKSFGRRYPDAGYGMSFYHWMFSPSAAPYNSWGNGSAMRVSPVGFACDSVEDVLHEAERSAAVTHNHPEGIKGAQATALAIFFARRRESKETIKREIQERFDYNLERTLDDIRPWYSFDVSCQGSVPESIIAFLEAESFEDAIRKAVSLGGDSDTMACIAGGIAHAFYGEVPENIAASVRVRLPEEFLLIIDRFNAAYGL